MTHWPHQRSILQLVPRCLSSAIYHKRDGDRGDRNQMRFERKRRLSGRRNLRLQTCVTSPNFAEYFHLSPYVIRHADDRRLGRWRYRASDCAVRRGKGNEYLLCRSRLLPDSTFPPSPDAYRQRRRREKARSKLVDSCDRGREFNATKPVRIWNLILKKKKMFKSIKPNWFN